MFGALFITSTSDMTAKTIIIKNKIQYKVFLSDILIIATKNIRYSKNLLEPIRAPSGMTAKIREIKSIRKNETKKKIINFNSLKIKPSVSKSLKTINWKIQSETHIPNDIDETAIEKETEEI
jgi:hypothetical protein